MFSEMAGKALAYISKAISAVNAAYVILALFLMMFLFLLIYIRQVKKAGDIRKKLELTDSILKTFQPGKGLEKSLSDLLGLFLGLVEAGGYYFYLFDSKNNNFVLKAARHADAGGPIGPDYSGLVSYRKEKYDPPLGIPACQQPGRPAVINDGSVPVLSLPVKGGQGLIRIGPVRSISGNTMSLLEAMCEKLKQPLDILIEIDGTKGRLESVSATSEAIRSLTRSAMDLDGSLSIIMALCIKMIDAAGGVFIFTGGGRNELAVAMGLEREAEALFRDDQEAGDMLRQLADKCELSLITREMKEYYYIPSYFAASGMESIIPLKVSGKVIAGTAVFWYRSIPVLDQHRMAALQVLARRLSDTLDRQIKFKELSGSYLDTLKMLVDMVDNLETYTVGHSELISRYSGIVAREMKLCEKEIRDITLAGYLHDVGMMGLSGDILFKAGKYTDFEFETMKLHAEVGASIVESTISNSCVASYIRHHHERWDGFGYPGGLKGGEIPLGARIIAVVDMFNAKITGRKYREPASFERAVTDLRAASGSQLDPVIVENFIGWFRKKQSDPSRKGRSLGPCWEMRCCPPGIHKDCPAYKRSDVNCWEIEGTKCAAHGNTCLSCIVYTEHLYRSERGPSINRRE